MLFNSFHFGLFFPIFAALFFLTPARQRWLVLLAGGYYLVCAAAPANAVLLAGLTLAHFGVSHVLARAGSEGLRRVGMGLAIVVGLAPLLLIKYGGGFGLFDAPLLGLSFYSLQLLGYTLDVYSGKQQAEPHIGRFAVFGAFFPLLAAGPIERGTRLLPQLHEAQSFEYARVSAGLRRMAWGLFKKTVIADRLAILVDNVYSDPSARPGPALAVGLIAYAYQIYCDFSGYTDIAIGAAQVLGFRIAPNFDRPYAAASVSEFWRRWHISLSSWFRDYCYIPLGGNRTGKVRWCAIILVVFCVSGMWHGAHWTFVAWGGLHAAYLMVQRLSQNARQRCSERMGLENHPRACRGASILLTFLCVTLAWNLFRAQSLEQAWAVYTGLMQGWFTGSSWLPWAGSPTWFGMPAWELGLVGGLVCLLEALQWVHVRHNVEDWLLARPFWERWCVYSCALWIIFVFGVLTQKEFIYVVF